jgi:hypothetical protein
MKDWQYMAAVAGVGFFTTLAVIGARSALTQPAATVVPLPAVAADPVTPAPAPAPAAVAVRESADPLPAPAYDQVTAIRDRAATHSARSR